jgi:hypothetical protein
MLHGPRLVREGRQVGYTHFGRWHGRWNVALPERRKVGGSAPPLTTRQVQSWQGSYQDKCWSASGGLRCLSQTLVARVGPCLAVRCCTWSARRCPRRSDVGPY